jgi:hypothetical protein
MVARPGLEPPGLESTYIWLDLRAFVGIRLESELEII